ncbi:beta-galactosidase [Demequina lignilytica]|uniref:Beta-galactosidase n=1 Tax=Demequina lignilytica TaxID=3051663 RepID=A0AB35MFM8_9MICO|nr:beta-galactosidase [Demequina sp. SYSU T0a273]MDN4482571.1 beta-galactosidase [Demequina sp. SYSU T0a273]
MTSSAIPTPSGMNRLWYGGDYNPEQWPREVWDDDMRLMSRAGVTVATIGVFSWARLEPRDGEYDLAWLDDLMDLLHATGVRADLATATASPPKWLIDKHPEILPVTQDGTVLSHGGRQHYRPASAAYREHATRLVRVLAERYGDHPALEAWHVNNEYGCHVSRDYSDDAAAGFRAWLAERYGTIHALNAAWGTAFWSQLYTSFDQVDPPRVTPAGTNPTQTLDFDRYSSDELRACMRAEIAVLREVTPEIPVTTNFMGFFKGLDYWTWAGDLDFVTDDHYPDPEDPEAYVLAAMTRDLMRGLGGGRPWILMEQATSAVNWRDFNAPKPAGMHRLLSLQSVARGADGIMQFQWRQSKAGSEKFHSAMVPHAGEDSRVYRETEALGAELASLSHLRGTRSEARVAMVVDWPSWWALEQDSMPARISYVEQLLRWYRALHRRGVLVDMVPAAGDLDGYDMVVVASALALSDDAVTALAAVPARGGQLVVGYQTAVLDEHAHARLGGYLGDLQQALGVWIEELWPLRSGALAGVAAGPVSEWGEHVRVRDAEVLATFSGGDLDGLPAITRRADGDGAGWYVATAPEALGELVERVLDDAGVVWSSLPAGVEAVERGGHRFVLNHSSVPVEVEVAGRSYGVPSRDAVIDQL